MMATPLASRIISSIRAKGPMSVSDYFALCLADPEYGYYRTRDPFGRDGDFITAPEVSQLFGEMLGIFFIAAWQRHGTPPKVILTEIGPGRGTMMNDMLRVISKVAPELNEAISVHLVETSERLQKVQSQTLADHKWKITWHDSFDTIPDGFTLLAANELFDAIPIRQFIRTPKGFRERVVIVDEDGRLDFGIGTAKIDPALLPSPVDGVPLDTVFEVAPARDAVMQTICARLARCRGTGLIIDYGHMATGYGDTLQAVRNHLYDPPLAHPGEADLTSHVDFEQLGRRAVAEGLKVNGLAHQGDFLIGLGILERAAKIGSRRDLITQESIRLAVDRLAGEGEGRMGELFKVLAISSPGVGIAPFQK